MTAELSAESLAEVMSPALLRFYPAVVSTEAAALAWARSGASDGAVVAAGYQASPRGRSGISWDVDPDLDLAFSLILRPDLPEKRAGWLYTLSSCGLADVLGDSATIEWPSEILSEGSKAGSVGVQTDPDGAHVSWAVINFHVIRPAQPKALLLKQIVDAVRVRAASDANKVLGDYLQRCSTIGKKVVARMIPLGSAGPRIGGKAVGSVPDGGLVILTEKGSRVVVLPQNLGILELEADRYPDRRP